MAFGRSMIVLLLLLMPLVAGCTTPGPNDDGDGNATDGSDEGDGADGSDDGDGQDGADQDGPAAREPVPPQEQEVDDPDDVDEPGEYALLPRAAEHTDARWTVPAWSVGDTWVYNHRVTATATDVKTEENVAATGTAWDIETYEVTRTDRQCDPEERSCVRTLNFTQDDLVQISDNGYIEHEYVFPLEDGKRWVYARDDGRGGATRVLVEARHEPQYLRPNSTEVVEAWYIVLKYEGEGNVQTKVWLGVEAKNVLRREIWADGADGVAVMHFATTLESYTPA